MTRGYEVLALAAVACSSDPVERTAAEPPRDSQPRRVIEPPAGPLRQLPPYKIVGDAVGPYRLRQKFAALLEKMPSAPRHARFEIPGLLHTNLIRTDDDTVLIGGEPEPGSAQASSATFVAVIGRDVALTAAGVHVGQTRKQLDKSDVATDPHRARDPRLVVPASLRNARIVLADDQVVAIAIISETPAPGGGAEAGCSRPSSTATGVGACLTAAGERIEVDGDEIVVRPADGGKPLASLRVPGLAFAAPLRAPDGRDEIVAIARNDEAQVRAWTLTVFAIDGGKRTTTIETTPLYQLQSAQARWIGADLADVELYLELTSRADAIDVGGLLTTRGARAKVRDVVPITPIAVARRPTKPISPGSGPGDDAAPRP